MAVAQLFTRELINAAFTNRNRLLAVIAAAILTGCGGDGAGGAAKTSTTAPPPPATPVLTTLNVTLSSPALVAGQTATASVAALDQNGAGIAMGAVAWSTSTPAVATINAAGVVTAIGAGQTQVIATASGKQGQATLTVAPAPPTAVASVTVTPSAATLSIGGTQQLTAATLDASGGALTGRTIAWSASNASLATVSATGLVTAVAAGTVTIAATSEGKSGVATITVAAAVVPVATVTVAPSSASLTAGSTQQLTATMRDASNNVLTGRTVTWSTSSAAVASVSTTGVVTAVAPGTATITATSETKIGSAVITVTAAQQACTAATALQLTLGEVRALTAAQKASLCVGSAGAGEYVLIPFNASTVAASQTQIELAATNTSAITSASLSVERVPGAATFTRALTPDASLELEFRRRERRDLAGITARVAPTQTLRLTGIPATPVVGSIYQLNSSVSGNLCAAKTLHPARVVAVRTRTIVFVDTLAPKNGYTDAELSAFGAAFDTLGFGLDTANFGAPTDVDANGRIAIFFTTGVNQIPAPSGGFVGGLFASRDLYSAAVASCPGSNEGEMFYMPVPDPTRTINGNYSDKTALSNVVLATLVHEFQHLINASRRIYVNNAASPFEDLWLNEGLSHIAEELLYYRVSGNSPRANIGLATLQSSQAQVNAVNTYQLQNLSRLQTYLAAPSANSPYALTDGFEMRGAIWQLLRYAADRKGGTEKSTWLALVNSTTAGLANFTAVFGDITSWTRDWAIAQFTDDAGLGPNLAANNTNPSWNLRSIYPALTTPSRFPLATVPLAGTTPVTLTLAGGGAAYVRFRIGAGVYATVAGTSTGQPVPAGVDFILVRTQ